MEVADIFNFGVNLKFMGWSDESILSVSPHYFRLAEADCFHGFHLYGFSGNGSFYLTDFLAAAIRSLYGLYLCIGLIHRLQLTSLADRVLSPLASRELHSD